MNSCFEHWRVLFWGVKDLIELKFSAKDGEEVIEDGTDHDRVVKRKLTLLTINTFLQHAVELAEKTIEIDPSMERSLAFRWALNDILIPYKEL